MALPGSGLTMGRLWLLYSWLCSWLLFIMLFMALCISSSMRCFSRLGIRPKRTAEEREENLLDYCPSLRHTLKQEFKRRTSYSSPTIRFTTHDYCLQNKSSQTEDYLVSSHSTLNMSLLKGNSNVLPQSVILDYFHLSVITN